MTSLNEIKKLEEQNALQKSKNKVVEALRKESLGLSIAQIMTICKLSIKTVKNILAVLDVEQQDGVYFLKAEPKAEIKQTPVAEPQPSRIKPLVEEPAVNIGESLLILLDDFPQGLNKEDIIASLQLSDKQFTNLVYKFTQSKKIIRSGRLGHYIYQLPVHFVEDPVPKIQAADSFANEVFKLPKSTPVQTPIEVAVKPKPSDADINMQDKKSFVEQITTLLTEYPQGLTKHDLQQYIGLDDIQLKNALYKLTSTGRITLTGSAHSRIYSLNHELVDQPLRSVSTLSQLKKNVQVIRKRSLQLDQCQITELLKEVFGFEDVNWTIGDGSFAVTMIDEKVA